MTTARQWLTILLLFSAGVLAGCYVPSPNYAAIVKPHAAILGFSGGGVCSGTIVGPRELLTASHCFDSAVLITVNDEPVTVITFRTDGADHTLLTLDKRFEKWAKVSKSPMAQGDSLFMYGNPRGGRDFYRRGYVIAVQEFAILVFGLCLWIILSALGILTLRIIGDVLDRLYPPDDEGQR